MAGRGNNGSWISPSKAFAPEAVFVHVRYVSGKDLKTWLIGSLCPQVIFRCESKRRKNRRKKYGIIFLPITCVCGRPPVAVGSLELFIDLVGFLCTDNALTFLFLVEAAHIDASLRCCHWIGSRVSLVVLFYPQTNSVAGLVSGDQLTNWTQSPICLQASLCCHITTRWR